MQGLVGTAWARHGPLCWQSGCFKSLEDPLSLAPCQTITGFVSFKAGQRGSFQWSPHKTSLWDEPSTRRGRRGGGGKRDRMTSAMTSLCSHFPKKSQKPYKERTKNTLGGVQAAPTPPPQNEPSWMLHAGKQETRGGCVEGTIDGGMMDLQREAGWSPV